MRESKLFVGGYYDDRIFVGDFFDGKTPFDKTIDTYTLSEVLKLAFVENVVDFYNEKNEKDWEEATEEEKVKAIIDYVAGDEIAGLLYFATEGEAKLYKDEVIKEVEYIEKNSEYDGMQQDKYGYFREVYKYKR